MVKRGGLGGGNASRRAETRRPPDGSEPSELELLRGFSTGDTETARIFVRRFQSRVYGTAVGVLHDTRLAEDVAQEAFVRAWKRSASYDPARASVGTWLVTITRNLAIDQAPRRRVGVVYPQDLESLPEGTAIDPQDAAIRSATIAEAGEALVQLPADQRRALLLAAYRGLTARQISEQERIPLGSAKTKIRRGMRQLRARLQATEAPAGSDHYRASA
jgi:RNA polymerase sigma-70 factor (ECF subfamily)